MVRTNLFLFIVLLVISVCAVGCNEKASGVDVNKTGHEKLQYEGMYQVDSKDIKPVSAQKTIKYINNNPTDVKVPEITGNYYQDQIPDTLDLAYHCALAIQCLTGHTDPNLDYDIYFGGGKTHSFSDICGVKYQEALPLMRIASGSTENVHVDKAWHQTYLKSIGPDGLYYINRPYLPDENMFVWCNNVCSPSGMVPLKGHQLEFFSESVVNGRIISVFTINYLIDKNKFWTDTVNKMITRLDQLMIHKGDYCYLPARVIEPNAVKPADAPEPINMEAEELGGRFIQSLSQYYKFTNYEPAKQMAQKLVNYMRYHSFYHDPQGRWIQKDGSNNIVIEGGHFHGHAISLLNMLEFGMAVNDRELIEYINKSYNWAKENTYSDLTLGWFPELVTAKRDWSEPCCTADMVALAVKLSIAGAGNYWGEAERWARNQLTAAQTENGSYGPGCCTGNAARALYYAWENIIDFNNGKLSINMLLNRTSKWADVKSYIPYVGKVKIYLKTDSKKVSVRIPDYVKDANSINCSTNGKNAEFSIAADCLNIENLSAKDVIEINFPIEITEKKIKLAQDTYIAKLKADTVISLQPHSNPNIPIFDRTKFLTDTPEYKKQKSFVSDILIDW